MWLCRFLSFATAFIHNEEIIELEVIAIKIVHIPPRLCLDTGYISSVGTSRVGLWFLCVFRIQIPLEMTRGFSNLGLGILIPYSSKNVRWQVRFKLSLSPRPRWIIVSTNSFCSCSKVLPISSHITSQIMTCSGLVKSAVNSISSFSWSLFALEEYQRLPITR